MQRRFFVLAAACGLAGGGCSTPSGGVADPGAKRREIDTAVDNALADLFTGVRGSRELANKSSGLLVLPKVVSAGFVVGGSYGEGALRKAGSSSAYYSVAAGSVGLLAGAQSKAVFLLFLTDDALQKFESNPGWTAGVDGSITIGELGSDARIDTRTAQAPIVGFVRTNAGFMANLSLDGTKFTKLKL